MDALAAEAYDQQYLAVIATNGTQTFGQNGFDTEDRLRDHFGTIWDRWVELRPGLQLQLVKYTSCYALSKWEEYRIKSPLISSFRLLGQYRALIPRLLCLEETLESTGCHYLAYTPDAQMLALLQQIWRVPFHPPMQRMHLESCVLQLLVLQLNQWVRAEQGSCRVKHLSPAETDKIYQARDLLTNHQNELPSPINLAQWVNLSDHKLQKGFREVFGTTVFGYLYDYRMEQAKLLLCDRATSVATVANAVGYAHLGYFAVAFKRKFGISPKAWQQGNKLPLQ